MEYRAKIMDREAVERALLRISHQIIEKNHGTEGLCLIGIHTRGVPLARRIAENIRRIEGTEVPVGALDVTCYRDDLDMVQPDRAGGTTEIPFSVVNRTVVLVDDVIYTGRTARAALDAIMRLGRAARIQLCVMVDRGHSELPIKATYVGKNIPTSRSETVSVRLAEVDGETEVAISKRDLMIGK